MSVALDRVTAALQAHGSKGRGASWQCPAHDDRSASLSVNQGKDGAVVKCHAACTAEVVVAALGLTMPDLFDTPRTAQVVRQPGVTLAQLAAAKKLPAEFLQSLGLKDCRRSGTPAVHMPYHGTPAACKDRVAVAGSDTTKWHAGHHARPYALDGWQRAARDAGYLLIVEGESDTWTARYHGVPAIGVPGKSSWQAEWAAEILVAAVPVYVWQEPDAEDFTKRLAADIPGLRVLVAPEGAKDISEAHIQGRDVSALVDSMRAAAPLAAELVTQYQQARKAASGDGAALLDEVTALYGKYVHFPSAAAAYAVALWTVHTHAIDAFDTTPYLRIESAEKQSGKTRLFEVSTNLVRDAKVWVSASSSAMFRVIDKDCPTVFFDEVDAIFSPGARDSSDLVPLLNSGHRRGGSVTRMVGEGAAMKPYEFKVFSPKALAGLSKGRFPDTLQSRCIVITMKRRKQRTEEVARFRFRGGKVEGEALRDRLAAWAEAWLEELRASRPIEPAGLSDRASDIWEPLFAIADLAGGRWPQRARDAAMTLSGHPEEDESRGVRLLRDIREVFGGDRLQSVELARRLVATRL